MLRVGALPRVVLGQQIVKYTNLFFRWELARQDFVGAYTDIFTKFKP